MLHLVVAKVSRASDGAFYIVGYTCNHPGFMAIIYLKGRSGRGHVERLCPVQLWRDAVSMAEAEERNRVMAAKAKETATNNAAKAAAAAERDRCAAAAAAKVLADAAAKAA